jgi:hypothetical protein
MVAAGARTRLRYFACLGFVLALVASVLPATAWAGHQVAAHTCPSKLSRWQALVKAGWIDCHRLENLNVSSSNDSANPPNPYTDPNVFFGMGLPPEQGAGTLHSKYTHAEQTPVSGIQIDGWFADSCNAFVQEPALLNKAGQPFIPGCTPAPGGTCSSGCHHDGQFVIRIPDTWDGHLLTSGTPGVRDAFASDFILSDYAMERGWAYVSQDKGNIGTNFYRSGADETACKTPWCPAAAIQEWTLRVRQATRQAGKLLKATARSYGLSGVTRSYIAGISNGGYQTRRAIESDTKGDRLYDGGVDWEGTLFLDHVPPGVALSTATSGYNLFTYLPTALANYPGDVLGQPTAVQALAQVGFNPQSQPLWAYHWFVYWGLTQKIYRLEFDPEYTNYTCSGPGGSCVSPALEQVQPTDPDASYDYSARLSANPNLATRIQSVSNTGDIQHPMITLHGDQDSLLPEKTDSDLYSQMVYLAGHGPSYRYYVVQGGNHVDPRFDDHYGVDAYGNNVLRPILPCARAAIGAMAAWVERGVAPPPSHTIARPPGASANDLANTCDLS